MKNLVLFASGKGSNVQAILDYFRDKDVKVGLIVVNKKRAGVHEIAERENIDVLLVDESLWSTSVILDNIDYYQPDLLVLAGFNWKIPSFMLKEYPRKIVNIHPSLLPKYGGKGMYGSAVHKAVIQGGETESGITVHLINENYDEGTILLQKKIELDADETPESLATKIHSLEHQYYPKVIESLL